ncbi:MAG: glycosyltransferase family 4 protein [Cyanobacteriota bacterium]
MKIWHALYQSKTGTGTLQVVLDLQAAAQAAGHTVSILARDAQVFAEAGAERFFTGNKLWDWLRFGQRIAQDSPDLVHVHDRYCSLLLRGIPNRPPSVQTNHIAYTTRRRFTLLADVVVGCSEAMDRHHAEFFNLPSHRRAVIQNGITARLPDPEQVAQLRQSLPGQGKKLCLTVARLEPEKGHRYLLEAIAGLDPALRKEWRFVMAGSGSLENALQKQAQQLGLDADVFWVGHTSQVPEWLALAEVFVLPSLLEGLPLSLLEAMAAGLACLATDVGGTAEALHPQRNGLLIPPEDVPALREGLTQLLGNAQLRRQLGQAAHADYQRHWRFERTWQQYEALYQRLHCAALHSPTLSPDSLTPRLP